jgi:DNA-binding CsgD family transcriptional regulator/tetratricopeptide (TPR) repeat protein
VVQGNSATRLYGRDLALVEDLINRAGSKGSAIVVRGEAGIGKSSLLAEVTARAREQGMLVLTTAGAQSETRLPFAGLHQLLRPVLGGMPQLEPAQRAALRAAIGLAEPVVPNPFMIGLAVLELIAEAATRSPVFVVADEAQWLDPSSCETLAFVARRVEAEPIVIAFGVRDGLDNHIDGSGIPQLHLDGLDAVSSTALLDANTPGLSRQVRALVLEYAEGNPLALLELPTALDRDVTHVATPLHLSQRLERAFGAQISDLGAPVSTLLLLAAIDPAGTLDEFLRAGQSIAKTPLSIDSFAPSQRLRLVTIEDERVRFRHPLLRSAVFQAAGEGERRQAHAALADVLDNDPDRRAWHRAAAAVGPDESRAQDLMTAAANAERRGAIDVAVAALDRAAALSVDPRRRAARLVEAAEMALGADRGQEIAARLLASVNLGDLDPARRALFAWLQDVYGPSWSGSEQIRSFVHAADEARASGDSLLALRLFSQVALRLWWSNVDRQTRELVVGALDRLEVERDDPHLLMSLAMAAPVERGAILLEPVRRLTAAPVTDAMTAVVLGQAAQALGIFDLAHRMFSSAIPILRRQARSLLVAQALAQQAWAAVHLGNIASGLPVAHEAVDLAIETGLHRWAPAARLAEATLTALRGDFERAESLAAEAESVLLPMGANPLLALVELARARIALLRGDHLVAYEHLKRISNPKDIAYHMYVRSWVVADLVEAAIYRGREQEARDAITTLEPVAAESRSPVLEIGLRFARALVASDAEAEGLFQAAITEDTSLPLMVARSQLAYGLWLRRQRRIAESRGPLRAARDAFQAMGATPLVERASRELRASGESSPKRLPRASDRLTPQELQIAQMAAAGMSNREIGQSLFLSHRTIGFHLYRLFPKLGITSRNQLRGALDVEALTA